MIKAKDAIRIARSLIGTPYSEMDCINLIKKVIRTAPGGDKSYTDAGSNSLWRSYNSSGKYRHITEQITGIAGAKAGMLAFKADGDDYHHVGIVTGEGTVIHSSSTQGGRGVVETPLTAKEGWTHLARHKLIEVGESGEKPQEEVMEGNKMQVVLGDPTSWLNVRNEPDERGTVINKLLHGQTVTVMAKPNESWLYVQYGDSGRSGYVSAKFLSPYVEEEPEEKIETTTVMNELTGEAMVLVGRWKIAQD